MKYLTKDFVSSATDVPMKARLVRPGENYGLWDDTQKKHLATNKSNELLVIFYDRRYKGNDPIQGNQISTYYLSTLMEGGLPKKNGLCLDGGVPDWNIGPKEYTEVLEWAERLRQKMDIQKGKPLDFSDDFHP